MRCIIYKIFIRHKAADRKYTMRKIIKNKRKRQTRTHNVNSRTISGKNHTSIISQSSQPKEPTFTNACIQIMQHWMLTVDVL